MVLENKIETKLRALEAIKRKGLELENDIIKTLLKQEKTIELTGIKAVFSAGRKTYNYEKTIEGKKISKSIESKYSTTKINYKDIAEKHFKIKKEDIIYSDGNKTVKIELK